MLSAAVAAAESAGASESTDTRREVRAECEWSLLATAWNDSDFAIIKMFYLGHRLQQPTSATADYSPTRLTQSFYSTLLSIIYIPNTWSRYAGMPAARWQLTKCVRHHLLIAPVLL